MQISTELFNVYFANKGNISKSRYFPKSAISKIPGKTLTKINQKVGFRFVTKFGEKGVINLGKLVPGVGAVIGGGLDYTETKIIGNRAYKWFFEGELEQEETENE